MKTFLTICICAMVSAGIYGFADMAVDVKNGTMIEYDRGDQSNEKAVTVSMLRKGMVNTQSSISKNAADFDLSDKLVKAKSVKDEVVPVSFFTDVKSFSRGDPEEYYQPLVYDVVKPETSPLEVNDSLKASGSISAALASISDDVTFSKKPVVKVKKQVSEVTNPVTENVVAETPVEEVNLTTAIKVDSIPQVEEKPEVTFDYREFSRGAPRKNKTKKPK